MFGAVKLSMAFSTHLLDQVIKQKEREQEATRQIYLARVKDALRELAGEIPFKAAFIFGSLTRPGGFALGVSDIDVAFEGLMDEDYFQAMSMLSAALGTDVDIVQLECHPLAEKVREAGTRWTEPD